MRPARQPSSAGRTTHKEVPSPAGRGGRRDRAHRERSGHWSAPSSRPPPASAATPVAHVGVATALTWQQVLPDAGNPVAQGSPSEATLDGGGSSVVDRRPRRQPSTRSTCPTARPSPGWPAHAGGPVDSTPSVTPNGPGTDNVFVGAGNAAHPNVGGYYAFSSTGRQLWSHNAQDANGLYGVQASMAVGPTRQRHRRGGAVAGSERVRPQRGQRRRAAGLAVLHRRQRVHHAVAGRPVRQRPDRGRRGW